MDPALLALVRYSAQILVLVSVATLAAILLRVSAPSVRFTYWRAVALLCLVVPWLSIAAADQPARTVEFGSGALEIVEVRAAGQASVTLSEATLWIVAAGALARFGWLLAGAFRLRQLRRRSVRADVGADIDVDRRELAPHAELRWSADLTHPVTFGIRRPVVLLPARFAELSAPSRRAVVRHELLHIARGDWIWIVIEEHARALFWFHPGVWWLVEQVQLAREQVIDQLVVSGASSKREYMTALMTFADNDRFTTLTTALLRRRHLKHRFRQLSKEAHMSFTRLTWTAAALALVTGGATVGAAWALPLDLGVRHSRGVSISFGQPARLEIRLAETMPAAGLMEATVSGSDQRVYLHPTPLATQDDVTGTRVIDMGGSFGVGVMFSDAAWARMESRTAAHMGRPVAIVLDGIVIAAPTVRAPIKDTAVITGGFTADSARQLAAKLAPVAGAQGGRDGYILPRPLTRVQAQYTADAMAAKIEGIVVLETVVLADGSVGDVRVTRSLDSTYGLDKEAVKAVSQWTWMPGTKDGRPVPVTVTIEVQFTRK